MLMMLPTRRKPGAQALLVSRPLDIDLPQLIASDTRLAFANWLRTGFASVPGARGYSDRFLPAKPPLKRDDGGNFASAATHFYTAGNLNNEHRYR